MLAKLNRQPARTRNHKLLYLSPRRQEKTPSFWVDTRTNRWYDFGDGAGGDLVDLIRDYLKFCREAHTTADALRWLGNMAAVPFHLPPVPIVEQAYSEPSLIIKSRKPIQHLALIQYVQKRGIPLTVAHRQLKEIRVHNHNTGKSFSALGFVNEEGGYELRNPFFQGSLGAKAISFIRGNHPKPDSIHLFEGCMDYLSIITQLHGKHLNGDAIITNSVAMLKQAIPYIQNYGYRKAYTWFDNDQAGEESDRSNGRVCQDPGRSDAHTDEPSLRPAQRRQCVAHAHTEPVGDGTWGRTPFNPCSPSMKSRSFTVTKRPIRTGFRSSHRQPPMRFCAMPGMRTGWNWSSSSKSCCLTRKTIVWESLTLPRAACPRVWPIRR